MHNSPSRPSRRSWASFAPAFALLIGAGAAFGTPARAQIVKPTTATATVGNLSKILTAPSLVPDGRNSPGDLYVRGSLTFSSNGPYTVEAKLSAPDPDDIQARTPANTYVSLNTATWVTIATGPGGVNQAITTRFLVIFAQNSPHSPGNATSSPIVYRINGGPPVAPAPSPPGVLPSHIADLDRSSAASGASNWTATVDILVYDNLNGPVLGAVVAGNFSSGGSSSCTTAANGRCTVTSSNIGNATASVTWTVSNITGANISYAPPNSDPDGDSNGTTISITKPPADSRAHRRPRSFLRQPGRQQLARDRGDPGRQCDERAGVGAVVSGSFSGGGAPAPAPPEPTGAAA